MQIQYGGLLHTTDPVIYLGTLLRKHLFFFKTTIKHELLLPLKLKGFCGELRPKRRRLLGLLRSSWRSGLEDANVARGGYQLLLLSLNFGLLLSLLLTLKLPESASGAREACQG